MNILTRLLKKHLDRTEPPLVEEDGLAVTEVATTWASPVCMPNREYVPAFPEIGEPLGSGEIPTVDGDLCFRCHKNPVRASASLWCDACRPIVWAVGAEPVERQAH